MRKMGHVIKQYLCYTMRLPVSLIMMILFPILLITILTFAFRNSFSTTSQFSELQMEYRVASGNATFDSYFDEYMQALEKHLDLRAAKTQDAQQAMDKVKNRRLTAFVDVDSRGEVHFYVNEKSQFDASMAESLIRQYFEKAKVISAISDIAPQKLAEISDVREVQYVKQQSLAGDKGMSSADYYSISVIVMMGLYASMSATYAIYAQRKQDVLKRIALSGMGIGKFMTGTVIGNMVIGFFQLFFCFLYSRFLLGANWGNRWPELSLIFLTLLFFSSSIGVDLGLMAKTEALAGALPQFVIPIFAFIGGAYFPVDLGIISYLSPIYWSGKAVNYLAYGGDVGVFTIALLLNMTVGLVIYLYVIVKSRRGVFS